MEERPDVIGRLASSLNRRDEAPNQELAKELTASKDKEAVKVLVSQLGNKDKAIQNDCIKVLYEIGEQDPSLISDYLDDFVALLNHKNNRLQWGGMTAINTIVPQKPMAVYAVLPQIMQAADKGSVITKDHAVNILIKLCSIVEYSESAFSLLNEQLLKSKPNQFPMYAERALPIVNDKNKERFRDTLHLRLGDLDKESKKKRIEKVLKKLG